MKIKLTSKIIIATIKEDLTNITLKKINMKLILKNYQGLGLKIIKKHSKIIKTNLNPKKE